MIQDSNSSLLALQYGEEASTNACLKLQSTVYEIQARRFRDILDRNHGIFAKTQLPKPILSLPLHPLITKRIPITPIIDEDDDVAFSARIDDVEITILYILDCSGLVTQRCQVCDLASIMSRQLLKVIAYAKHIRMMVHRYVQLIPLFCKQQIDHRALLLHILNEKTSTKCLSIFCELDGLRILRSWIKLSLDEDSISLLRSIIALCSKIPFNIAYVKRSDIGKAIKRALKHRSTDTDLTALHEDIRNIMNLWKEKAKETTDSPLTSIVKSCPGETLSQMIVDMDQRLVHRRGLNTNSGPNRSEAISPSLPLIHTDD